MESKKQSICIERDLTLAIFGAVLTLIGDLLIGYVQFPEGAGLVDGYLSAALTLPVWRPIVGGLIGFLGISLEFLGMRWVHPLFAQTMPRSAGFYKLSSYVYLAVAGGAVHLPCGVLMWLYHSAADLAGRETAYALTRQYVLYFMVPVAILFFVCFVGAGIVQFVAFFRGRTPFPRGYCVFNLLIGTGVFNCARFLGNNALTVGIATSNKSLGAIAMFLALLIGYRKYIFGKGREIPCC